MQLDPTLCACGCGRERPRYIFQHQKRPPLDLFWAKIICDLRTHCWLWTSAAVSGYGVTAVGGLGRGMVGAHRRMWEILCGPIPKGLVVMHLCDVLYPPGDQTCRRCCNPDHLKLGTPAENSRHMAESGRASRVARVWGEHSPEAKLTDTKVRELRIRYAQGGISYNELAKLYGVNKRTVVAAILRATWKHVD